MMVFVGVCVAKLVRVLEVGTDNTHFYELIS